MLPDDLFGPVALDALGADVPRGDAAPAVEHEDGVVLDALHDEAEPLFALLARFLDPAARTVCRGAAQFQRLTESRLELSAVLDLVLEQSHALLEQTGAFRRNHVGVRSAHPVEQLPVARLVEVAHRVGAEERERVASDQVVPQFLQPDGGLLVSIAPEEIDHLAVETHARIAAARQALLDHAAHDRAELLPVGLVAVHESGKRFARIEQLELSRRACPFHAPTSLPQPL